MQTDVKQVFYFNADASAVGGFLHEPFRSVPTPCSAALSSTGGHTTTQATDFNFEDGIKARAAYTHVSGRPSRQNGPWTQRTVSVVEGFNLLDRVTADRLVAQMFIEQPAADGGPRKISFAGSHFSNLRIDGRPIEPVLDATLLPPHHREADAYNRDAAFNPELEWPELTEFARRQGAERLAEKDLPGWGRERLGWIAAANSAEKAAFEGYTLCSLVNRIEGVTVGQASAHFIDLPDFGRIFLAEVTVLPYAAHLTMLRAELGCKVSGQVTGGTVGSNGTTMPPG